VVIFLGPVPGVWKLASMSCQLAGELVRYGLCTVCLAPPVVDLSLLSFEHAGDFCPYER
jgi:hypothetical protein